MVKPPELRSPWQRQIHARRLQSHSRKEVIVAADAVAVAAAVVVVVAVLAAAIPPSAASLPPPPPLSGPPLLLPLSLPPLPGAGPAGSRVGEAERGPRHRKGNARAAVKLFPLPTAPWLTRNLGRKSLALQRPLLPLTKTETKQKNSLQTCVICSFLTSCQKVQRSPCKSSSP